MRTSFYIDGCEWGTDVRVGDLGCGWGETIQEPGTCHFTESIFCTNGIRHVSYLELGFDEPVYQYTTLRDPSVPCTSRYELVER